MVSLSVISGIVNLLGRSSTIGVGLVCEVAASSATLRARSTACLSGEGCVGVCGESCGVKVGDTALSSIWVAHSALCLIERDEVNWIVDKSSGPSPTKPYRWSVIVAIGADRVGGRIHTVSGCLYCFGSVQSVEGSLRSFMISPG